MKVHNDERNMVFDNSDPRCVVFTCYGLEGAFGFVQCLDLGWPESRLLVPEIKRYWGPWNADNPEGSVRRIMAKGGKWPMLPSMEMYKEYTGLEYVG
ncbi:hypothetical protein [Marinobacter sp.]|uniref:hypothetical protein n=1 Tax=Marinobacter sp. TaxID=50741 RepID=UPI003A91EC36